VFDILGKLPLTSVVIRTKNEQVWLPFCLESVLKQKNANFEIIIVDNQSTDNTLKIAESFNLKVLEISEFLPGKALNMGFEIANGEIIVALSGHCVPTSENWLANLLSEFGNQNVAGVYGRQVPVSTTSARDKRDLYTVFGPEKRLQRVDPFFHNANSAIPKDIWQRFPFDESVTNVEDRVWGKKVIEANYSIIYTPNASVYHWHGINHDGDEKRAIKVVNVLEQNNIYSTQNRNFGHQEINFMILIAIREKDIFNLTLSYFDEFLKSLTKMYPEKQIVIIPDSISLSDKLTDLGYNAPFIRDSIQSMDFIDIREILKKAIVDLELTNSNHNYVLYLNANFPLRKLKTLSGVQSELIKGYPDAIFFTTTIKHSTVHSDREKGSINSNIVHDEGPFSTRKSVLSTILMGFGTFFKIDYLLDFDQNLSNNNLDLRFINLENSLEALELKTKEEWDLLRSIIDS